LRTSFKIKNAIFCEGPLKWEFGGGSHIYEGQFKNKNVMEWIDRDQYEKTS
jgi:hypothetical protein